MRRDEIRAIGRPTMVTATSSTAMNEAMIRTKPRMVLRRVELDLAIHCHEDAGQIFYQDQSQNEVAKDAQEGEDIEQSLGLSFRSS